MPSLHAGRSRDILGLSTSGHARRVARIDGVRAVAALSVLVFHVWLYRADRPRGERTELLDQALFAFNAGLICFFVLSGYLLYGAFARAALRGGEGVAIGPYLRRRAARIVPAAWACGAGCLALYGAVGYHAITPSAAELPAFALFLQNYSPATMGRLNPVLWTLGVEVAFYATLPLVGWAALRLGRRRAWTQVALLAALIAVSPAWNVLVLELGWGIVAQRALPAFIGVFGVGMLVALWGERRRLCNGPPRPLRPAATAALVAGAVALVAGDAMLRENGWWLDAGVVGPGVQAQVLGHLGTAAGFALLIAAAAWGSGPGVAWLGLRPLAALGTVSYGLYLWHLPLLLVARQAGLLPDALVPRMLVVLALSVVAAAASWHWIERPWIDRASAARRERARARGRAGAPAQSPS
jgi:peptidoglycan/LPS O-acetylase OafA/YrhL